MNIYSSFKNKRTGFVEIYSFILSEPFYYRFENNLKYIPACGCGNFSSIYHTNNKNGKMTNLFCFYTIRNWHIWGQIPSSHSQNYIDYRILSIQNIRRKILYSSFFRSRNEHRMLKMYIFNEGSNGMWVDVAYWKMFHQDREPWHLRCNTHINIKTMPKWIQRIGDVDPFLSHFLPKIFSPNQYQNSGIFIK